VGQIANMGTVWLPFISQAVVIALNSFFLSNYYIYALFPLGISEPENGEFYSIFLVLSFHNLISL
jgi:hypothetical protein